ncbi:hypothetical protein MLD38_022196 [Melastoma candidum]|uniref:Uncharacterized protein n=1 Tax=Melastoma candidum TaxID=119954 RepID=A0ACB9QLH5_9MYRT|nr:hypothetical protein MLD38_022196 [Melastoma candidum]
MKEEGSRSRRICCEACGSVGIPDDVDGFFYCSNCGSQAPDFIDTDIAEEHFVEKGGDSRGAMYMASNSRQRPQTTRNAETLSQHESQSQLWSSMNPDRDLKTLNEGEDLLLDSVGPTSPEDFVPSGSGGSRALRYDDFYNEVRIRYALGLQLMVQLQCEALVRDFNVSPVICGIAGTIWFRFLTTTRIMADGWADDTLMMSESQKEGVSDNVKPRAKYRAEPHNIHGQRGVIVWFRSMQKKLSLSHSLAISFLACHVARESILPTDVVKGSTEGKIPYVATFLEIERILGSPSRTCPLSSSFMFRPTQSVQSQELEAQAAFIALVVGLDLPPVNFYAIASRYLCELSLPAKKIFPRACRLYDWSMPPNLWLSANESSFPTRVCVMSILIVAIRIIYNIHGFGEWEKSLSKHQEIACPVGTETGMQSGRKDSSVTGNLIPSVDNEDSEAEDTDSPKSRGKTADILKILNAQEKKINDSYEFNQDTSSYLKFCKEVLFAGLEAPFEDYEETKMISELWYFYQSSMVMNGFAEGGLLPGSSPKPKMLCYKPHSEDSSPPGTNDSPSLSTPAMDHGDEGGSLAYMVHKSFGNKALEQLKADMEEDRFLYIPPRVKVKRFDYLHYARKRDEGSMVYIAHADYYVLLRACARVAEVDVRCMHLAVLDLERRLGWLENRIDHCLNVQAKDVL